jgi:signal peptidase I
MAVTEESKKEAEAIKADDGAETQEEPETLLEAISSICFVLVLGLFAFSFVFQNFVIPSGSMEKTLLIGDHVVVDRDTFAPPTKWAPFVHYREPRRGDVIVFLKPNPVPPDPPDIVLVKRLIGVPGDHIHLVQGVVYINGVKQTEPYAAMPQMTGESADGQDMYTPARDDFPAYGAPGGSTETWTVDMPSHLDGGDIVVPPGKFFAMGDNREHSLDGRFWGFVPRENILGRPMFNYWSFDTTQEAMEGAEASFGGRVSSFFQTALHFFDKTRWKRTLHLIK